jgi:glycosyltransferase involved in cell wall biosynthesis
MNLLSVENFHTWSWPLTLTILLKYLPPQYRVFERVVHDVRGGIIPRIFDGRNLILLQNVDSLRFVNNDIASHTILRIGGIAMPDHVQDYHELVNYDRGLRKVSAVISTNCGLHRLAAKSNKNSFLIPNGVDLKRFKPIERERDFKVFKVGFAGNVNGAFYMNYKGYPYVVGACQSLFGQVQLVTAFYGNQQLAHTNMPELFYYKLDCLVNASEGEGCSNVIMEALACGVPVICTRVGYHGEHLEHELNCLFVERTAESIQNAIVRLQTDNALWEKLRLNGRKFAIEHHNIERVAEQYAKVFDLVLHS